MSVVAGSTGGSDRPAHVCLTLQLTLRWHEAVSGSSHRVGDRVEGGGAVAPMFDDVLPPPLWVGVAGSGGEFAQRVGRGRFGNERCIVATSGERDRQRKVDGMHLDASLVGPADRLPLGAECGERREGCSPRRCWHIGEQRDWWHQAGLSHPTQCGVDVGGCFDEHDVGLQLVERPQHRAGRSGAVVADTEQVDGHVSRARQAS